jgi:polyferredoxin
METNSNTENEDFELQKMANKKVIKLKAFYTHLFIYLIGIFVYVLKEYVGVPLNFPPLKYINLYVMGIWTVLFLISAIDALVSFKIFGEEWEKRKLKSIMEKKTKKQKWE